MRNRKIQRQLRKEGVRKTGTNEKPWLNSEGYNDPTAYAALKSMEREERMSRQAAAR